MTNMAQERFRAPLAVFIIFQKEDQIWLQRRANTGYRDGEYDVPSGHVEVGEAMSAAAVREAKEEIRNYSQYDYVLVNREVNASVERLAAIVEATRSRRERMEREIEPILETFENV